MTPETAGNRPQIAPDATTAPRPWDRTPKAQGRPQAVLRIGRPPRAPRRWPWLLADIATQTALGFGLALIAVGILVRDVWI